MKLLRQEPVVAQSLFTSLLNLAVPTAGLLVAFNVLHWNREQLSSFSAWFGAVIVLVTAVVGFLLVRNAVTPLANPQAHGNPLIEARLNPEQVRVLNQNPDHPTQVRDALTRPDTQALRQTPDGRWETVMPGPP